MPCLNPTVDDFITSLDFYRKQNITPKGWCEVIDGTTVTKWHQVKDSNKPRVWRILSRKRSVERPLTGIKYSSAEFYSRRGKCGTKVKKILPTAVIPNLPGDIWCPTEECFDVPKHITIMIFEADGYMLGRDPKYPLERRSVSENASTRRTWQAFRSPQYVQFGGVHSENGSLRSLPSWDSGSAVWTWFSSNESSMESESVTAGSEPDIEDSEWIAPAVAEQEKTEGSPRAEAWNDCDRIWFTLPPSLQAMMDSAHYSWVDRLEWPARSSLHFASSRVKAGALINSRQNLRELKKLLPAIKETLHHLTKPVNSYQTRFVSAYGYEQAKCLVFDNYGEPKDVLRLHSHSISPPHRDLLTLRFLASPINPADINQIQGVYPSKPTWTTELGTSEKIAVGGNEGVAEVIAAGSGVKDVQKGDWVIFKGQGFGTWRTHAQTTSDQLIPIRNKEGLKPEQVGTVSINPCTAYRMLTDFVDLKPGEWFIQNGANSGVGRAAIQLGKLWGYKSINIVRKRDSGMGEMRQDLKSLGADVVVTDEEVEKKDFRDKVKELTNGGREPIRLGLNCVGGSIVNSMAKHLAEGSHVVTYGAMSKQPVQLPLGLLIFKNITFDGFWVSKWSEAKPKQKEECVEEILNLTREGKFKDTPMDPLTWDYNTKQDDLVKAVSGTLEGFRSGKGIFLFGET